MNWLGVGMLFRREVTRFLKVYLQTLLAPVATALLFLTVFTLALGQNRAAVYGVPFAQFLAPGVVMMTVIQNAFANTSSSIMIAKVQGSIYDTLTPPLSAGELTAGIVFGGASRGVLVALFSCLCLFPVIGLGLAAPLWAIFYAVAGAVLLALLGVATGIWATKFDQMAAVTNFVILPLSFLSGTFYATETLPAPWRTLSDFNPFHYLIEGFRYGVLGPEHSPLNPWVGALVSLGAIAGMWILCWRLFATGYRLKS
ncbi:MAG: ABC transporter permease [Neomegalonema sp.]|nr:ABC transporter permease [Neomegalonema sp.]